jgi:Domain of unknown function (DUF6265)
MRKTILLFTLHIFFNSVYCQNPDPKSDSKAIFKKLEWLTGTWNRTNIRLGRTAYEKWEKVSDTEMKGVGVTMDGGTTVFTEKLKILVKDNLLWYVADVPENKEPVYFKITVINENEFVCENPEHDFPQKILYKKEGNKMKAVISGGDKSFEYLFEKQ